MPFTWGHKHCCSLELVNCVTCPSKLTYELNCLYKYNNCANHAGRILSTLLYIPVSGYQPTQNSGSMLGCVTDADTTLNRRFVSVWFASVAKKAHYYDRLKAEIVNFTCDLASRFILCPFAGRSASAKLPLSRTAAMITTKIHQNHHERYSAMRAN